MTEFDNRMEDIDHKVSDVADEMAKSLMAASDGSIMMQRMQLNSDPERHYKKMLGMIEEVKFADENGTVWSIERHY